MLIAEVMKPDPITISDKTKLNDAYKLMLDKGIRHLPVIKNWKLVGLVTDRDLKLATSKLAKHPFNPDTEVEKDFLTRLIDVAEKSSKAGLIFWRSCHPNPPSRTFIQIWTESMS